MYEVHSVGDKPVAISEEPVRLLFEDPVAMKDMLDRAFSEPVLDWGSFLKGGG